MDTISVIIPVYNVLPYLERCIKSVQNQTYSNLEIILVDDGSTDGSDRLCDISARQDQRIRVIHRENGGLSAARNTGLEECTGEYVAFVDSDDFISLFMIERMYCEIKQADADIAVCGHRHINEDGNSYDSIPTSESVLTRQGYIQGVFHDPGIGVMAWNKLYSRKLFNTVRYPEGHVFEDGFTVLDIAFCSQKAVVVKEALYYYTIRKGSITGQRSYLYFSDAVMSVEEMEKSVRKNDISFLPLVNERHTVCRIDWWKACAISTDRDGIRKRIMDECRCYIKGHWNDITADESMKKMALWAKAIVFMPFIAELYLIFKRA